MLSISTIASSYRQHGFGYADYPEAFGYAKGEYGVTLTSPTWRRSIVVSKAKRMVDVSIALFARFAGNNRITDLLSMLA
jgi:hypothetical protein